MPRSGCSALHGVNPNLKKKKLTFRQISPNTFLLTNCSMKITVGPAVGQADLRIPDMNRVN